MKKVFAIAALAFSMSIVSCGGDKGASTSDSDTTKKANTEAGAPANGGAVNGGSAEGSAVGETGNAEVDALMAKLSACTSIEEMQAVAKANADLYKSLPANLQATLDNFADAKAAALQNAGKGAEELIQSYSENVEIPASASDAVEAAQAAAQAMGVEY